MRHCAPEEKDKSDGEIYEEETALHILCDCMAFSNLRIENYGKPYITPQELITGNITQTIKTMIKFMDKTTVLTKIPKINKHQLSPRRPKKRKRKTPKQSSETQAKRPKQRKITNYSPLDT